MARKRSARRRRSRLTPRRWLPFVALTALVVGATVSESDVPSIDPARADSSLDVARVATVTRDDAISSGFYCSGGTAQGSDGLAEMTIVFANSADEGATAELTAVDEEGNSTTAEVDVPAGGRARIAAADILEAEWIGVTVEVIGGRVAVDREVSGDLGFDASPCSTEIGDQWYVPSGSTKRGAEEYLSFFNPLHDATSVDVAFATDTGPRTPRALRGLVIPGGSLRVVKLSDLVTDRSAIAATVRAKSGRVVVDRIQTYDGTGDELVGPGDDPLTTPAPRGLISTPGSPVRADRWIIAGSKATGGVRNRIAVYNPGTTEAEVDLLVVPQEPLRSPAVEPVELTIRPKEQAIVDLPELPGFPPDLDVWIDVRSLDGVPIVAERLSFFGEPAGRTGAAVTAGAPFSATRWLVPQGGATSARSSTVQVVNPGSRDATITVTQLSGGSDAEVPSASITVPAGDRRSLELGDVSAAASLVVDSTVPVVVGSSMSLVSGHGIAIEPAFAYPEAVVALPPIR